ncbi:MAG: hypothetical protein KTR16_02725 [Acidiferrobacterales bacterium]|nr:hypothetical protein [Acidiferrobacterales bacterium]
MTDALRCEVAQNRQPGRAPIPELQELDEQLAQTNLVLTGLIGDSFI